MKQGQTCLLDGQSGTVAYGVGADHAIVLLDDDRRVKAPVDRLIFPTPEEVLEMAGGREERRRARLYRRSQGGTPLPVGHICRAAHVVLDEGDVVLMPR